jgi:hypothetical protein
VDRYGSSRGAFFRDHRGLFDFDSRRWIFACAATGLAFSIRRHTCAG